MQNDREEIYHMNRTLVPSLVAGCHSRPSTSGAAGRRANPKTATVESMRRYEKRPTAFILAVSLVKACLPAADLVRNRTISCSSPPLLRYLPACKYRS